MTTRGESKSQYKISATHPPFPVTCIQRSTAMARKQTFHDQNYQIIEYQRTVSFILLLWPEEINLHRPEILFGNPKTNPL